MQWARRRRPGRLCRGCRAQAGSVACSCGSVLISKDRKCMGGAQAIVIKACEREVFRAAFGKASESNRFSINP